MYLGVDIGSSSSKAVVIDAAGTGRFLEVMTRVLGCGIGELSTLASRGTPVLRLQNPQAVGALGAAIYAAESDGVRFALGNQ
jgi:activator of 2-hydroxyglutaryl-CoA dehydratase